MNSDSRRKAIRALKERGYSPVRDVRHGVMWKNSAGAIVIVARPTKTDDPRAFKNLMKNIERNG